MKKYQCRDCKEKFPVVSMWICPDDRLRCGDCMLKLEEKKYPANRGQDRRDSMVEGGKSVYGPQS